MQHVINEKAASMIDSISGASHRVLRDMIFTGNIYAPDNERLHEILAKGPGRSLAIGPAFVDGEFSSTMVGTYAGTVAGEELTVFGHGDFHPSLYEAHRIWAGTDKIDIILSGYYPKNRTIDVLLVGDFNLKSDVISIKFLGPDDRWVGVTADDAKTSIDGYRKRICSFSFEPSRLATARRIANDKISNWYPVVPIHFYVDNLKPGYHFQDMSWLREAPFYPESEVKQKMILQAYIEKEVPINSIFALDRKF